MLGAPLAFLIVMGGIYWFSAGGGRRYLGIAVMGISAALLAILAFASIKPDGPSAAVLIPGIAVSVGIGWLGYKMHRWMPRESSPEPILAALVTPTPTTREIGPRDVLGRWRFYVDAAAGTVIIDLRADGRYEQAIDGNSSKRITGPGGEWKLDGPNLELSAYRSATCGDTAAVRWFFGDCEGDLILFVKDDPQAETMLAARREAHGDNPEQASFGGAAGGLGANLSSRKASSRGSSLFVSHGRLGHGGKPARYSG